MKYVFIIFITLFFLGCSNKTLTSEFKIEDKIPNLTPNDLSYYPQYADPYLSNFSDINYTSKQNLRIFFEKYFAPWTRVFPFTKEEVSWAYYYKNKEYYGENYQQIPKAWFEDIIEYSNIDALRSISEKAIVIENTNLRVFPSHKPIYAHFKNAGEGFPFDYNQNSSIKLNTPLLISHYSKDQAWAYVSSPTVAGWIDVKYIALVDDKFIKTFTKNNQYYVSIQDKIPLYKNKIYQTQVNIATLFPLVGSKLAIAKKLYNNQAYISTIDKNENIVPFPLPYDKKNIARMIDRMINIPYGWGGLYGNRDCSALTQDFYTLFSILLHRNSSAQKTNGIYTDISKLSHQEKIETIKEKAIPFMTLFYFKGHIGIYLGTYKNEPVFFHATWGIKIKDEDEDFGRIIVGKSIISSLKLGKEFEQIDSQSLLLEKMQGFTNISN